MLNPLLPHLDNVRGLRDRVSSAANPKQLRSREKGGPYVDRLYGHSWAYTPRKGAAVYGLTANFRPSPIDHLGNGAFLRVPFRRVPILEVGSLEELQSFAGQIHSMNDSIKLMWRGQSREYYLSRTEEDSLRLFGECGVLEPSLVPSAARTDFPFSRIFEGWAAILDAYMMEHVGRLGADRPSIRERVQFETANFRAGYNYRLWALATAQHYGLPSVGLDVTPSLDVALLFALHRLTTDPATGATTIRRVDHEARPVVFALGGFTRDLLDDGELAPPWLQCVRPKAQAAFFLTTGWGLSANKAAERLVMAIRLKDHECWRLPKPVDELFPSQFKDKFLAFLLAARTRFAGIAKEARLECIYYAA